MAADSKWNTFDIRATPTLIINGWKFPKPLALRKLDEMTKAVLAGEAIHG